MMCNVSYVVCGYSMLNGVIDSREVRRVKAAGLSWSSGAASHHRSRQGTVEDTRLQDVISQRDAYYQNCFTSQQEKMSNHYANVLQQQMQVSLSDSLLSLKHWRIRSTYELYIKHASKVLG
jgi:TorA maturation chaperone TorD